MDRVTHVIFDMDGLLINTEDLYTMALDKFCRKFEKEFTIEIKMKMMGRKTEESARVLIDALNLPCSVEEYKRYFSYHMCVIKRGKFHRGEEAR